MSNQDFSLESFVGSRRDMSISEYLEEYLSENDREGFAGEKLHVYAHGIYIEEFSDKRFGFPLFNSYYEFDTLQEAEKFLWEEFAEDELG